MVCAMFFISPSVCVSVCVLWTGESFGILEETGRLLGFFFVDGPFILWRFMSHYLAQHRGLFVGLFFALFPFSRI